MAHLFDKPRLGNPSALRKFRILEGLVDERYIVVNNNLTYGVAWLRLPDAPPYREGEDTYLKREGGQWPQIRRTYRLQYVGVAYEPIPIGTECFVSSCVALERDRRKGKEGKWRVSSGRKSSGMFDLVMPEPGLAQLLEKEVSEYYGAP